MNGEGTRISPADDIGIITGVYQTTSLGGSCHILGPQVDDQIYVLRKPHARGIALHEERMMGREVRVESLSLTDRYPQLFSQCHHRPIGFSPSDFRTHNKDGALCFGQQLGSLFYSILAGTKDRANTGWVDLVNGCPDLFSEKIGREIQGYRCTGRGVGKLHGPAKRLGHGLGIHTTPTPGSKGFGGLEMIIPFLEAVLSPLTS